MLKWLRSNLILLGMVTLTACYAGEPTDTKAYFMLHPEALNKALEACQAITPAAANCSVVNEAGSEMRTLLEAEQRDPQMFGYRIIKAEMQLAETGKSTDDVKVLLTIIAMSVHE